METDADGSCKSDDERKPDKCGRDACICDSGCGIRRPRRPNPWNRMRCRIGIEVRGDRKWTLIRGGSISVPDKAGSRSFAALPVTGPRRLPAKALAVLPLQTFQGAAPPQEYRTRHGFRPGRFQPPGSGHAAIPRLPGLPSGLVGHQHQSGRRALREQVAFEFRERETVKLPKSGRRAPRVPNACGGGGGIRTHGTHYTYNGFRDRPVQPLRHPSACASAAASRETRRMVRPLQPRQAVGGRVAHGRAGRRPGRAAGSPSR